SVGEISVKTGNNARNGGKNSLNRLIRCVCGKKIGPDPRNFNQRVSLGRNDLLIRTFPKQPRRKITRQRLTLEEWQKIFDIADENHKYMGNAMLLAIVTGQRLGDISRMKFSDIWDDHLHVEQEKTGSKIAIPLALRCNAINWSLRDVISRCRDYAVSPYLVHFFRTTSQAERGAQVKPRTLTMNFSKARDSADIDWGQGTPATFHEQRSLSERLYKAQGINTKDLLGHKTQQQTDRYHDDRGKGWTTVAL
ncbi:tyrosine-type recombinase/integrase, partial [Klebsiella pneumoniae]|uniref:tyrosine-type recombinase/integrase n=2 Tax=Klebsiella pneumoniae TaxID=573 RepID=UPI00200BBD8B